MDKSLSDALTLSDANVLLHPVQVLGLDKEKSGVDDSETYLVVLGEAVIAASAVLPRSLAAFLRVEYTQFDFNA